MVIVLIHWKIKPDKVDDFFAYWQRSVVVQDRKGLIGEFLSEGCNTSEFPWITWDLSGCEGLYRSFINVGIWRNAQDFHEQIGMYFKDKEEPEDFEHEHRVRTILRPKHRRVGDASLPSHDSGGTL